MTPTPQEFYERVLAHADDDRRLPLPAQSMWEAHLHVFLFGRPAGLLQLRGSNLALWEEMLPRVPAAETAAVLAVAVEALADLGEARA